MIFPRSALKFRSKQRFVSLHRKGDIVDDTIVVHVAVRKEFRDMINPENDFTLVLIQIFVHGDINREFIAVPVNPSGKIVVKRNRHASFSCHRCEPPQIVAIIGPPETMPLIIAAAVAF